MVCCDFSLFSSPEKTKILSWNIICNGFRVLSLALISKPLPMFPKFNSHYLNISYSKWGWRLITLTYGSLIYKQGDLGALTTSFTSLKQLIGKFSDHNLKNFFIPEMFSLHLRKGHFRQNAERPRAIPVHSPCQTTQLASIGALTSSPVLGLRGSLQCISACSSFTHLSPINKEVLLFFYCCAVFCFTDLMQKSCVRMFSTYTVANPMLIVFLFINNPISESIFLRIFIGATSTIS